MGRPMSLSIRGIKSWRMRFRAIRRLRFVESSRNLSRKAAANSRISSFQTWSNGWRSSNWRVPTVTWDSVLMAALSSEPLPRNRLNRNVSTWSSAWCARKTDEVEKFAAARAKNCKSRFACRALERTGPGQLCQGLRVKRQPKTMTEPVDEFAVLEALGSAQIVIQVANHQVAKSDHRKKMQ